MMGALSVRINSNANLPPQFEKKPGKGKEWIDGYILSCLLRHIWNFSLNDEKVTDKTFSADRIQTSSI